MFTDNATRELPYGLVHVLITGLAMLVSMGCSGSVTSPSSTNRSAQETYLAMINAIEAGASLEEVQQFASKERNSKTENRIAEYMVEKDASREAVVALMHSFLKHSEECRDRKLKSEIAGSDGKISLTYTLTDVCEGFGEFGVEVVIMVREADGWKVAEVVSNESY